MTKMYELHSNVLKIAPAAIQWQFALSASLISMKIEEEVEHDESDDEVVVRITRRPRPKKTALFTQKGKPIYLDSLPVAPGLTVITADTEGGKTVTAIRIVNALADQGIKSGWITLQETAKVSAFFSSIGHVSDTLSEMSVLPDVIVIDSFRLTQFGITGGSTRAGGVSSKLFELLTELNSAAEEAGIALIVLFNPLAKDEQAADTLNRDVASSVNTVVTLRELGAGELTTRVGDSRQPVSFSVEKFSHTSGRTRAQAADSIKVASAEAPALSSLDTSNLF